MGLKEGKESTIYSKPYLLKTWQCLLLKNKIVMGSHGAYHCVQGLLLTSAPINGVSYWKEVIHLWSELGIVPQVSV